MKLAEDQLTLGQLIDLLVKRDATQNVFYDFGRLSPLGIHSYRGFYEDIAIGFDAVIESTVAAFLGDLQRAVGQRFVGYKGGGGTASRETALWVAPHNEATHTIITGIEDYEHATILRTRWLAC